MAKSKWSAIFSLLMVFVSGAVLGAFAHRLYMVKTVASVNPTQQRRPTPEEIRQHVTEELHTAVKLDDQQMARLNEIYDQTGQRADLLRKKSNQEMRQIWDTQTDQIRAMLRPDQLDVFNQWHEKREQERRAHRGPGGGRGGSGGPEGPPPGK